MRLLKLFFLFIGFVSCSYAANSNSPLGYWKTIDDVTGKPKSIIHIYETNDHTLDGQVIRIYPRPGQDQNELCDACKGDKHNQRIVGMVILTGMKQDGEKWDGGEIMDPKNGKTYRCTMRVMNEGENLDVRGYIGLPLLGRTQTWNRVEKP